MSLMQMLLGAVQSGYNLQRSVRFRASASANLSRTFGSLTARTNQTVSLWFKIGTLSTERVLYAGYDGSSGDATSIILKTDNTLQFNFGGGAAYNLTTSQVFRDPSAWYHLVIAYDTTQATASNRVKMYLNGVQVTAFSAANYPVLNATSQFSYTNGNNKIAAQWNSTNFFDGYMAEFHFIDGQQLTPSSFGSTNALTGVWQPAAYTGTYGTNGFYLPFTDNSALTTSSNVGLGKDFSGNGNYWTTNNISITAGVTYDSMTDVPTLTSATAANYAVLNPLDQSTNWTLSDANLKCRRSTGTPTVRATIAIPASGKYYFEYLQELGTGASDVIMYGLCSGARSLNAGPNQTGDYSLYCAANGFLVQNGSNVGNIGTIPSVNQIVQVAVDVDNSKMWFGINNSWYIAGGATTGNPSTGANPTLTGALGGLFPMVYVDATVNTGTVINFGQRPFAYTPPTGFVALNTFNLPTATIVKGNTVMDATLYTGTNVTGLVVTNAAGFKPDLLWVKSRNGVNSHVQIDSVRGITKVLNSNTTGAEQTATAGTGILSINSTGFTLGTEISTSGSTNSNGNTYVAWQWQAGQGSSSSNTAGSITSTVSVNASAGFSVVTYTGTGANATVGHGLGVAPKMIITKHRTSGGLDWLTYHSSIGNTGWVSLNTTGATVTGSTVWNNTSPTSSVFSIGTALNVNQSGQPILAYCWAEIDGFSKFGSYTGNGSTDGPFVYTGFRPKFVMIKRTDSTSNWYMFDTSRNTFNVMTNELLANSTNAEANENRWIDGLSNGFKIRNDAGNQINASGGTMIYMAYAENPFRNSLAR